MNNTFYGPMDAQVGHTIIYGVTLSDSLFQNNLFVSPSGTAAFSIGGSPTFRTTTISKNMTTVANMTNSTPSGLTVTGNYLSTDPLLVDPTSADFQLQSGSPAIDVGLTPSGVTTDIVGTPRPQGAAFELGAYEYTATSVSKWSTSPRYQKVLWIIGGIIVIGLLLGALLVWSRKS